MNLLRGDSRHPAGAGGRRPPGRAHERSPASGARHARAAMQSGCSARMPTAASASAPPTTAAWSTWTPRAAATAAGARCSAAAGKPRHRACAAQPARRREPVSQTGRMEPVADPTPPRATARANGVDARIDLNSDLGEGFGRLDAWATTPPCSASSPAPTSPAASTPATRRRSCAGPARRAAGARRRRRRPRLLPRPGRASAGATMDVPPRRAARRRALPARRARRARAAWPATAVRYVKPHGALYNAIVARRDARRARWSTRSSRVDPALPVLGLAGSPLLRPAARGRAARGARGLRRPGVHARRARWSRAASRAPCCTTRPRWPSACCGLARDGRGRRPSTAARSTVAAESICVHGDTPGAVAMAAAVRGAARRRPASRWAVRVTPCAILPLGDARRAGRARRPGRGARAAPRRCSRDPPPASSTWCRPRAPSLVALDPRGTGPDAAAPSGWPSARSPSRPSAGAAGRDPGARTTAHDLAEVAALTGLAPAEVVARHTGRPWTVAFGGFAPGFAYLTGGDPASRCRAGRRRAPRSRPASVGLAGAFSGVYPRASPGRLAADRPHRRGALGHGPLTRRRCSRPGTACGSGGGGDDRPSSVRILTPRCRSPWCRTSAGPGYARLGVGPSGASTRRARGSANRLRRQRRGRGRAWRCCSAASPRGSSGGAGSR